MTRGARTRILALAALAPMLGCGDGGGSAGLSTSGPNPPIVAAFFDDFSGDFPGANWILKEGAPAIDANQGNPAPGLSMTNDDRARTAVAFRTAGPLTLSVDLGMPGFVGGQLGRARIDLEAQFVGPDTSAEIRLEDGTIDFEILNEETEVAFAGDSDFHTFTFRIDANQLATWSLDGVVVATRADFPVMLVQIDLRSSQHATAAFVFDNVTLDARN